MAFDKTCPDLEILERYAKDGGRDDEVAEHLSQCGTCSSAVRRLRADNDLLNEFAQANADRIDGDEAALPEIPGYEIIEELHRGGQGVVYRAVQTATRRPAAVKVLQHGVLATSRQRSRFEREVELAALLRHPNVVTLYECSRTAGGADYLSMELIEGATLGEHLPTLPAPSNPEAIRSRLSLFLGICRGVEAAHRRGIIHRDLKPANIIVDADGEPRILDFGIARRVDPELSDDPSRTVAGEFLGTFNYASPEQVSGDPHDVDVRCDVYSLGIILYEMLTGERPYKLFGSVADIVQEILEADVKRPSSRAPAVDDEVDTIVLTALQRDADRRYQSAGALAEDVRRYLADEPIAAKSDSGWYLFRKAASRHRAALSVAVGIVLLLVGFGITMTVLYQAEKAAEARATLESDRRTATLLAMVEVLGTENLKHRTSEETIPMLFAEVDRIVDENLTEDPEAAAAIRQEVGLFYLDRSNYETALTHFEDVLALRDGLSRGDSAELAEGVHNRARALWFLGRYDEAEAGYTEALAMRERLFGSQHPDVAMTMSHLGATMRQQGRLAEAEKWYRDALAVRRQVLDPDDPIIASSLNSLGVCLRDQRKFAEAADLFGEALVMVRPSASENDARVASTLHNLGTCLIGTGDLVGAEDALEEAMLIKQSRYEDTHASVAITKYALGRIMLRQGDPGAADVLCREALAAQQVTYGDTHIEIADSLMLLAEILLARNSPSEAEPILTRAATIREETLSPDHWSVAQINSLIGECRRQQGRNEEVESLLLDAHLRLRNTLGEQDQVTQEAAERLALFYEGAGRQ